MDNNSFWNCSLDSKVINKKEMSDATTFTALKWIVAFLAIAAVGLAIALTVVVVTNNNNASQDPPLLAPTMRFSNGLEIPVLGLGTFNLTGEEGIMAVKDAIDRGYRHIDGAWLYLNEAEVGQAVSEKIAEGVIDREDMFIVNKLWSVHHKPELVRGAIEASLRNMNLDYFDLYLIHWPISFPLSDDLFPIDEHGNPVYIDNDILDTWRVMEELVDAGLTKSIGVSNFNITQLDNIIENARIKPVNNQVEVHPHCLNKRLIEHCKSRDVIVTGYSPLGAPGRDVLTIDERFVIMEPVIRQIAVKHRRTPAQVLLRYQYQTGTVAIPKSITRDRIITNFDIFNFHLDDDDIDGIESIDYRFRTLANAQYSHHPNYPFHDNCD